MSLLANFGLGLRLFGMAQNSLLTLGSFCMRCMLKPKVKSKVDIFFMVLEG